MTDVENVADWQGKDLIDRDGDKIGKLEDVYVDTETDEPVFGAVKEGLVAKHLTFVPLGGATAVPDGLKVSVSKAPGQGRSEHRPGRGAGRGLRERALPPLRPRLRARDDRQPAAPREVLTAWR